MKPSQCEWCKNLKGKRRKWDNELLERLRLKANKKFPNAPISTVQEMQRIIRRTTKLQHDYFCDAGQ